ncbi:MAG TPA: class A beta-lactamase [Rhodanobacteraceae bacterium]|nr:class A beta-lactamase [Rhodanobacteraceae bacterium]
MMHRRHLLHCLLATGGALLLPPAHAAGGGRKPQTPAKLFGDLEREFGLELAVAILDSHDGSRIEHRAEQRVALLSTFKWLLAAMVLARVDHGEERLDRRLIVHPEALLDYAPVSKKHLGPPGMQLAELCAAAVTLSDNTAANVLLAHLGGPAALTAWLRAIGDDTSRLDRTEPGLNDVPPGALRDTTTPAAMLRDLKAILLGDTLRPASRKTLLDWLRACQTGSQRLRFGLPPDWDGGDKTGSSAVASDDVAIFWPPARKPLLIAAYCRGGNAKDRDFALASIGRMVVNQARAKADAGQMSKR